MESIAVLLPCSQRFNLICISNFPNRSQFFSEHAASIRAVVGSTFPGSEVDVALTDSLMRLEIISCFSDGVDKVDLGECKERRIRVTNTPDVLTDNVADIVVGLMLAVCHGFLNVMRYVC